MMNFNMARFSASQVLAIIVVAVSLPAPGLSQRENHPPEIHLGMPYSEQAGVIRLSEDTPLKSFLAIMEVKDADEGPAGEVSCRTDNEFVGIVLVYPKAYKVELMTLLDRELQASVEVAIVCADNGMPAQSSTAKFTIVVMDVNDNTPIFTKERYHASVREGVSIGTFVIKVKANDQDAEINGVVEYSLLEDIEGGTSPFRIDTDNGKIYTDVDMDRESASQYKLTVVASDLGLPSLSSSVEVTIEIEDINDNAPVILNKELHTRENQNPMSLVGKVRAMDLDTGKNSELTFSKIEDDQTSSTTPFLVQPDGSIMSVVTLDREQRSRYSMAVLVTDNGDPPQSSTSTIVIVVDDVNDNKPVITSACLYGDGASDDQDKIDYDMDEYEYVDERGYSIFNNNVSSGFITIDWYYPDDDKIIDQVRATDEDSGENARLVYSIESVTSSDNITITEDLLFKIDAKTGKITLRRPLDPEDDLVQILNVVVSDKGNPSHSAVCALNITIDVDVSVLTTPITTQDLVMSDATKNHGSDDDDENGASTVTVVGFFVMVLSLFASSLLPSLS